ncbi:MAG: hypothetical protein WC246_01915 [Candidatus Paceibacterota bacterium]
MKRTILLLGVIGILIGIGYMAYASFAEEGAAVPSSANAASAASSAASLIP